MKIISYFRQNVIHNQKIGLLTTVLVRYLSHIFYTFALLLFFFLATRFFVVSPGRVNGLSMDPTFKDEQLFFVNKFVYLFYEPKRYDVVQIIDPQTKKLIIKRVVGLPGESVIIKRGKVYIVSNNGIPEIELSESYLSPTIFTTLKAQNRPIKYFVSSGTYFVLGDNRGFSTDSRYYGPVRRENIVGKVF